MSQESRDAEFPDGGYTALVADSDANPALSIPPKRLAGSADCLNCGTGLQGPFCHFCGQPDKNFLRFFPALMRELLEDFFDFDSRFMRTLKPLLFRPGKLTRDYLDGRRFRFVPPLRLYIFSSLAFFFLAAILASDAITVGEPDVNVTADNTGFRIEIDDEEEEEAVQQAMERLESVDPALAEEVTKSIAEARENAESDEEDSGDEDVININGEPWDRETNPFVISWMPDWVNDWVNDEIEESPQKGKEIEANPNLITDQIFDVLPATMFVLLPIVALLFKIWYLFARKYYIEHLIFALHNHSFIFVAALLILLLGQLAVWVEPSGEGRVTTAMDGINTAILLWIPVYMFVSLKRVYGQGWGMTFAKFSLIGISYLLLLGLTTAFVALLSFVLI
ncbi:MAG: DUF3667 domain-containing protein [Gammaproteobacteria bacterium]|nr:DUF3667 domain-containing protein [Gammaproteobacteria bacterium]